MKKNELIEIIRVAVRAELKDYLPKLVRESVNNCLTTTSKRTQDPVELAKSALKKSTKKKVRTPKETPKEISPVQFTKNTALNEALNATIGGVPQEGSMVSGVEHPTNQVTNFNGQEVDVDELPDHVSNALTRDYSAVLAAIDKKKGGS